MSIDTELLILKLLITPFLIIIVSLSGERLGSTFAGIIVGLPLTTGPISFILAKQYGIEFAVRVVSGNFIGQISLCIYCIVYYLVSRKYNWIISFLLGISGWISSAILLNTIKWNFISSLITLLVIIVITLFIIPKHRIEETAEKQTKWDIPIRIAFAVALVFIISNNAIIFGPQLSGVLSTFPVYALIFSIFTHIRQGLMPTDNLLHGIVIGMISYIGFFIIVGLFLDKFGILITYLLAVIICILISSISYYLSNKRILIDIKRGKEI